MRGTSTLCALLLASAGVSAIELNLEDDNSIKSAARSIAWEMMQYYSGNESGQIPGLLPAPYYWWEAGAMFGSLIDYWYYTGDSTYNDIVSEALLFQVGPEVNFMPPNQSRSLGNDDQAFWGLAAMSAAEVGFPNPPAEQPQWLALAQAVYNSQAVRWDMSSCAGGLKWQIFSLNTGYSYKNSISNGCFFNLAARLGAYTNNNTYLKWADRAWDWSVDIGLINDDYDVFDGTESKINCTELNHDEWTYNTGVYLLGASVMWNQTTGAEQKKWEQRVNGFIAAAADFFQDMVMVEICESTVQCNLDQQSFKAYTARWMAASTKFAPWIHDTVMGYLSASAYAAAKACTGGDSGNQCGMRWTTGAFDGLTGVGEHMNALEVIQSNLIAKVRGPVTSSRGGTSKGDPSGGLGSDFDGATIHYGPVKTSDRAGAGILTAMLLIGILGFAWWMID